MALISTTIYTSPTPGYAGTENVVWNLAVELGKMRHTPVLIAPQGSKVPINGELIETVPPAYDFGREANAFGRYVQRCNNLEFDIIHDHSMSKYIYMAKKNKPEMKVISTLHSQCPSGNPAPVPHMNLVCLSNSHAIETSRAMGIPIKYVHNGINLENYRYEEEKGDRFLYLGRMARFKGPHIVADLAERHRFKVDLCGEDVFVQDPRYVHQLMGQCKYWAKYWGSISHQKKADLLSKAKALIFPCMWPEPFGLTLIEANASGTPVITMPNGAIPEIIQDGVNGFLCDSFDEIVEATKRVDEIDPKRCREVVEKKFTSKIMTENYVTLYEKVLKGEEW